MEEIMLATHNTGKVQEVQAIVTPLGIHVKSLDDVGSIGEVIEETGTTYEENAFLKAREIAKRTNLPTIADDSGLEVSALPGELGVYSARFAPGTDTDRCIKLLERLQGKSNRAAKFVSVIAFVDPHQKIEKTFRGEVEGVLAEDMKGEHGFGYDPLFIPNGYTKRMAELGPEVKNKISHRARALQKFVEWLSIA
jgi:XTP/dITP diphosphohydrolase